MRLTQIFSRPNLLALSPVLLAIVLSGALSFGYNRILTGYRAAVEHTFRVITAIDELKLKLQDAETGQRGFVITGDEVYLGPFADGSGSVASTIQEIRSLVGDNEEQIVRLVKLDGLAKSKLAELQNTIEIRRTRGFDAAQALVLQHDGKQLMDQMRNVAGEMRASELQLLETRTSNAHGAEKMTLAVALVCVLLSIAGRLIARFLEQRSAEL